MPVLSYAAAIFALGSSGPSLNSVEGSAMRLDGKDLVVGLKSGGLACFDTTTSTLKYQLPATGAPVREVLMVNGQPWWIDAEGTAVYTTDAEHSKVIEVAGQLAHPVKRLSQWQNYVIAHSDTSFNMYSAGTRVEIDPKVVLPADIYSMSRQGVMLSYWKDGGGLLAVLRRYGTREGGIRPGETRQMGMLTAWSGSTTNGTKLLGSYVCDMVDFKDASGPTVAYDSPTGKREVPYGTGPVGNIRVGPEGIIGVDFDEVITIPFYKHNWVTNRTKTVVMPKYAQNFSYSDSAVWWSENGKLYQANAEDGAVDVYQPLGKPTGEVVSIAADPDGAWILQPHGIKRINFSDMLLADTGYLRFPADDPTSTPINGQQRLLASALSSASKAQNGSQFLRRALKTAGVKLSDKESIATSKKGMRVADLQYGDVILDGTKLGFYTSEGTITEYTKSGPADAPLELSKDAIVMRFLRSGYEEEYETGTVAVELNGPIFPVGIGKPNPRLGHDLFAQIHPGAPFDQPSLPSHFALQAEMETWIGTPYRWGGSSLDGTDCSGFVTSVYRTLGISLPRHSQAIGRAPFGHVVYDELHYGDVLVFPYPKHVAIYVGNGQTIETTQGQVNYSTVWRRDRAVVRRFLF